MKTLFKIIFILTLALQGPITSLHANETLHFIYQDPYGNLEMKQGQPSANPEFNYTDKEFEEDLEIYYFQARYYDPVAGRFWGRDKESLENHLENKFQYNPYQFVNNNPNRYTDPDGKVPLIPLFYGAAAYARAVVSAPDFSIDAAFTADAFNTGHYIQGTLGVVAMAVPGISAGLTRKITNKIPENLEFARVITNKQLDKFNNKIETALSAYPGATDAFITTSKALPSGLSKSQIAENLGIGVDNVGAILRFKLNDLTGLSSPINKKIDQFVGNGLTSGKLPEFTIPNYSISKLSNIKTEKIN